MSTRVSEVSIFTQLFTKIDYQEFGPTFRLPGPLEIFMTTDPGLGVSTTKLKQTVHWTRNYERFRGIKGYTSVPVLSD